MNSPCLKALILTFLFMSSQVYSQIPGEVVTFDTGLSSISAAEVGDVDNDGDIDLLICSEEEDLIVILRNDGTFLHLEEFMQVDNPSGIGIADLNQDSQVDYFYSSSTSGGLQFYYGITPDFPDGSTLKIFEDDLSAVSDFEILNKNNGSLVLASSKENNLVYFFNTFGGSMFFLGYTLTTTPFTFDDVVQSSSLLINDTLNYYIADANSQSIVLLSFTGNQSIFALEEENNIISGINQLGGITSLASDDEMTDFHLVSNTQAGSITKYTSGPGGYTPELFDDELINPGLLYLKDITQDDKEDLFVIDGNVVWMYDGDLVRNNNKDKTKITEEGGNIKQLLFTDFNSDGSNDIIIVPENSGKIKILSNAPLSSNNSLDIMEIDLFPNPVSDYINLDINQLPDKLNLLDLNGRVYTVNVKNKNIYVGDFTNGIYLLYYKIDGQIFQTKIVIIN